MLKAFLYALKGLGANMPSDTVATIEGVTIRTNKRVRSANSLKVEFTDGSWCYPRTGKVVNLGPGYIDVVPKAA